MTAVCTDSPIPQATAGNLGHPGSAERVLSGSSRGRAPSGLILALLAAPPASAHPPGATERVNVSGARTAGDDASMAAAISGDRRFVAFWSFPSTRVPGD